MKATLPQALAQGLADPDLFEVLFDRLPEVVFFAKDLAGRYVLVNRTLLERCGIQHRAALIGRTAEEVFPAPLGASYTAQDRQVLKSGEVIRDKLELHLYPGGREGWCLTFKTPLRDLKNNVIGLTGISRDLHAADQRHPEYRRLAQAVEYLQSRYHEPLRLESVAGAAGLSLDRFERLVQQVLHLTPRQFLTKTRIEAASRLLRSDRLSIVEIAQACGYGDHSAFTRQFRATVGLTPSEFRAGVRPES